MSILNKFFQFQSLKKEKIKTKAYLKETTSWPMMWTNQKTGIGYQELSNQGYVDNIIAYRCMQLIARGLGSIPWLLYSHNYEIEKHNMLGLLKQPNLKQADVSFREELVSHLLISGNAYIHKTLNDEGVPIELSILRPDRVKIIKGEYLLPVAYQYNVNDKEYIYPVDPITGACQLAHIKFFNPINDWYGMGPLQAALKAIDQHNAVGDHNLSLLQNGGRPSGAFIIKPNAHGIPLTEMQRKNLSEDVKNAYEGASNAGRVLFLEGEFDWKEMGLSLKDLDFINGKNLSAREIAQAFGVPPMLVGVPGDATFANYKEARYHLWEDTILPLMDLIVGEFNKWLSPHYSDDLRISYDADCIPALALRREASWEKIAHVDFLTINEKRQAVGYGEIPKGDCL